MASIPSFNGEWHIDCVSGSAFSTFGLQDADIMTIEGGGPPPQPLPFLLKVNNGRNWGTRTAFLQDDQLEGDLDDHHSFIVRRTETGIFCSINNGSHCLDKKVDPEQSGSWTADDQPSPIG